jgi:regulatory protein
MRAHLSGRGVQPEVADQAVAELTEQGYLDDERFAGRFAEDRRTLDHWGTERIERRLRELGIEGELAAAAAAADADGELDAAVSLLARRFPSPPREEHELNRALGLLVRRGYELELAHDAIRAFARIEAARRPSGDRPLARPCRADAL